MAAVSASCRRYGSFRRRWALQNRAANIDRRYDALIMPGVNVGNGAFISSRSVITSDVPAYDVVGGNALPGWNDSGSGTASLVEQVNRQNHSTPHNDCVRRYQSILCLRWEVKWTTQICHDKIKLRNNRRSVSGTELPVRSGLALCNKCIGLNLS